MPGLTFDLELAVSVDKESLDFMNSILQQVCFLIVKE